MSDQEHARAELLTGDDGPHSEDQVLCLTLERKDRERKREREREQALCLTSERSSREQA